MKKKKRVSRHLRNEMILVFYQDFAFDLAKKKKKVSMRVRAVIIQSFGSQNQTAPENNPFSVTIDIPKNSQ